MNDEFHTPGYQIRSGPSNNLYVFTGGDLDDSVLNVKLFCSPTKLLCNFKLFVTRSPNKSLCDQIVRKKGDKS